MPHRKQAVRAGWASPLISSINFEENSDACTKMNGHIFKDWARDNFQKALNRLSGLDRLIGHCIIVHLLLKKRRKTKTYKEKKIQPIDNININQTQKSNELFENKIKRHDLKRRTFSKTRRSWNSTVPLLQSLDSSYTDQFTRLFYSQAKLCKPPKSEMRVHVLVECNG